MVAVSSLLVPFGVSIPECDAHTYIYATQNSVTIMCLTLRRSAIILMSNPKVVINIKIDHDTIQHQHQHPLSKASLNAGVSMGNSRME